jgi:hypothetical protein
MVTPAFLLGRPEPHLLCHPRLDRGSMGQSLPTNAASLKTLVNVILNLFQDNRPQLCVVLKQVQDDEKSVMQISGTPL